MKTEFIHKKWHKYCALNDDTLAEYVFQKKSIFFDVLVNLSNICFLGPHLVPFSVAEGPLLVPFSLKIRSPFGPLFDKFRSPFHVGAVHMGLFTWGSITL